MIVIRQRRRISSLSGMLVALFTSLTLFAASPSGSQAAEFGFVPCGDDANAAPLRNWGYQGQQMIGLRATCGQSVYQFFQVPVATAWGENLRTLPLGPGTVEALELVVRGRDPSYQGMDFALAVCNGPAFPADCGDQVRGVTAPPYLPQFVRLARADGQIPDGADRLVLFATCTLPDGEYCPSGDSVVSYSDLYVTENDPTPPEMSINPLDPNVWLNTAPAGNTYAQDPESGIHTVVISANGSQGSQYLCTDLIDAFGCPRSATPYDGTGVPLIQGRNTLSIDTSNAAAMHTEAQLSFLFDDQKPAHPVSVRALGTNGGWLIGDTLRLHWQNPNESVPSATQSGIVSAVVDLQPSNPPPGWGPLQSEHEFTGGGIDGATLNLPWPDTWTIKVSTIDAAGNKSDPEPITIDNEVSSMSPPTVNPGLLPILNIAGTSGAVTFNWQKGNFGRSGDCGYRGWIGKGSPPNLASNPSARVADPGVTSWTLSQAGISKLSDGDNTLALAGVDCAGDVSQNMTRTIPIDRVRPTTSLEPASRWLAAGSHLTLSAQDPGAPDTGSGVKSVWYRIDGGSIVSVLGDAAEIPATDGDHTLEYGAVDLLGNPSAPIAPARKFGIDREAPRAAISPAPGDPGAFNAVVSDSVSGVVDAWCEISSSGRATQSRLGDRFVSAEGQTSAVSLGLRIPDDGSLAPGNYDLRVVARDAAGNIQTAVARTVRLPLRAKPSLTTSIYSAARRKVSHRAITLKLGAKAGLRGTLRDASGAPIGGATLRVVADRDGGARRVLGQARTAADGRYATRLGVDVSRTLTVTYDGDATNGATSATARQNVRARVSMKLSARHVRRGARLFASGRVRLLSASVPSRGVPLAIQFCARRGCTRVAISARTDSDGKFSVAIPTSYSSRTRLVLRARVDPFPGWPFAGGSSGRRKVVIR